MKKVVAAALVSAACVAGLPSAAASSDRPVSVVQCMARTHNMAIQMTYEPEFRGTVTKKLKNSRRSSWNQCYGTAAVIYWVYPQARNCTTCHRKPGVKDKPYLKCAFRILRVTSRKTRLTVQWSPTAYTANITKYRACMQYPF